MSLVIDDNKVHDLYKSLGDQIVKAGRIPTQIITKQDEFAAREECKRFLLNYEFQMWENLVVIYLMYQHMGVKKLFFEDLEDTYYRFVHDELSMRIFRDYIGY